MAFGTTEGTIRLLGADYLDITLSAIVDVTASSTTVTVTDPEGNTATEYDGTVTLYAYDAAGSYDTPNVPLSTDGITYPSAAYGVTLTLTAGTWTGDLYFDLPGSITNPITLAGIYDTEVNGYQPSGRAQIDATVPILVFTAAPISVKRGEAFTLTIEAQDESGTTLTDLTLTVTLALVGADVSDVLSTTEVTLTAGVWTSAAMTITGGSGDESGASITASADEGILEDTVSFYIVDDTSLYENTDNNWTQGEASNSPWSQSWALFNDSASHGWRYEGDGIGWTATTNASSLVARVQGPGGTEDVPLDVEINGVVVGQIVIRLPNSEQYTNILETPILAGDSIRLKLTKSYASNIYQMDHMVLFP